MIIVLCIFSFCIDNFHAQCEPPRVLSRTLIKNTLNVNFHKSNCDVYTFFYKINGSITETFVTKTPVDITLRGPGNYAFWMSGGTPWGKGWSGDNSIVVQDCVVPVFSNVATRGKISVSYTEMSACLQYIIYYERDSITRGLLANNGKSEIACLKQGTYNLWMVSYNNNWNQLSSSRLLVTVPICATPSLIEKIVYGDKLTLTFNKVDCDFYSFNYTYNGVKYSEELKESISTFVLRGVGEYPSFIEGKTEEGKVTSDNFVVSVPAFCFTSILSVTQLIGGIQLSYQKNELCSSFLFLYKNIGSGETNEEVIISNPYSNTDLLNGEYAFWIESFGRDGFRKDTVHQYMKVYAKPELSCMFTEDDKIKIQVYGGRPEIVTHCEVDISKMSQLIINEQFGCDIYEYTPADGGLYDIGVRYENKDIKGEYTTCQVQIGSQTGK